MRRNKYVIGVLMAITLLGVILAAFTACQNEPTPPLSPAQQRIAEEINRLYTIGTSQYIVLVGDVEVSRTRLAYDIQNLTEYRYSCGGWQLARFVRGRWEPVPFVYHGEVVVLFGDCSLSANQMRRRETWLDHLFGALTPGRYLLVYTFRYVYTYSHSFIFIREHVRPDEALLIEFVVRRNTPMYLE